MSVKWDDDVDRLIREAGGTPSEVAWAAALAAVLLVGVGVAIGVTS